VSAGVLCHDVWAIVWWGPGRLWPRSLRSWIPLLSSSPRSRRTLPRRSHAHPTHTHSMFYVCMYACMYAERERARARYRSIDRQIDGHLAIKIDSYLRAYICICDSWRKTRVQG
jgi:hypothetical protein